MQWSAMGYSLEAMFLPTKYKLVNVAACSCHVLFVFHFVYGICILKPQSWQFLSTREVAKKLNPFQKSTTLDKGDC